MAARPGLVPLPAFLLGVELTQAVTEVAPGETTATRHPQSQAHSSGVYLFPDIIVFPLTGWVAVGRHNATKKKKKNAQQPLLPVSWQLLLWTAGPASEKQQAHYRTQTS